METARTDRPVDLTGIEEIASEAELRELIGEPSSHAANKTRHRLQELDRQWLARSPFCLIATADAQGRCDVSPKGDPAGFTHVLDDTTLVIPDRPGNKRLDGLLNILGNPHVGLNYVLPGRGDTLRINGRARVLRDAPFFDELIVKGNRPRLALLVEVEEVYYHCSKAFLRSDLWKPETWQPEALPSRARIVKSLEAQDRSLEELEEHYGPGYAERLYG
ncbi:pyridoxamine 5'-phosphate oxidase family protein [Streptomyces inhibens]|uniref:Pyridoxamine 5'-phosphate oxidase family protein n=1 Tax=Streptomyces inhibens TaxID=2293571 RepID=A0A371PVT5_STRIH|nr:pyridoxamine 5'-phosphate oxidase family protein [Streptomyces inhibens]REK86572.1 pyridoxamine 5'-phosphate oxidase family protein [Streptomyces inhibens]UKY49300.1 pyridoxamine 5'-phosphate oxidase family protein [Streptomyces inhibens]